MKISVAMATYNGEKYLYEQLDSLFKQTKKIDEVIICDDCSSDNTVKIITDFIRKNSLELDWKVLINKDNKGYTKNFIDCVKMTTGDIVFFCDQDDIWHEKKVEKMLEVYEKYEDAKAVSCVYKIVNNQGEIVESFLNKMERRGKKINHISFYEQINKNSSCGMILSVKKDFFLELIPYILEQNLSYDLPVGAYASLSNGYYQINDVLAFRRIHGKNTSNPKLTLLDRFKDLPYHLEGRKSRINYMRAYSKIFKDKMNKSEYEMLIDSINSLEKSFVSLINRNILNLFVDIFNRNPMINNNIAIVNLLCAIFGDYTKLERENCREIR